MNEDMTTPWQGDWNARLRHAIERQGKASLLEFLAAHPGKTYFSLASILDSDIAPMQIYGEQLRVALATSSLKEAAADCLVRFLAYYIKRGWGNGKHFQSRVASAFAAWKTCVCQFGYKYDWLAETLDAVWNALESANPPKGWMPTNVDDLFIQNAFAKGWGQKSGQSTF